MNATDVRATIAYLRRFAVEKNWPRLDECADVVAALEAEREQLIGQITNGRAAEEALRAEYLELTSALARKDEALRQIRSVLGPNKTLDCKDNQCDGCKVEAAEALGLARAALGQA